MKRSIWTAIKRTPATLIAWMLVGAMILPGVGLLSGSRSALDFAIGTLGGCVVAIILRAVVVTLLPKKSA